MYRNKKWMTLALSAALAVAFSLSASADSELIDVSKIRQESVNYVTDTVHLEDITVTESCSGYDYYPTKLPITYDGEEAYLVRMTVLKNSSVKEGDPIMELRRSVDAIAETELQLKLQRAKEALSRETANMQRDIGEFSTKAAQAEDPYQQRKLSISAQIRQVELEQYKYSQQQVITGLEKELEELQQSETFYVTAPFDGTIIDLKSFEDGQLLKKGDKICTLRDDSVRMVRLVENEMPYGREVTVNLGRTGNFGRPQPSTSSGDKIIMTGKIVVSSAVIPNASSKFSLIAIDPETVVTNRSWDFLTVTCDTATYVQVPAVRNTAINLENGKTKVSFLREDGTTHERYVSTVLQNRFFTWIGLGAEEGDQLVIAE